MSESGPDLHFEDAHELEPIVVVRGLHDRERVGLRKWCSNLGIEAMLLAVAPPSGVVLEDYIGPDRLTESPIGPLQSRPWVYVVEKAPSLQDYLVIASRRNCFTLFVVAPRTPLTPIPQLEVFPVCFDYLRRPFGTWELLWRVRGALAHVTATQQHDSSVRQYLRYGPILYDKLRREVRAGNTRVDLRPAELEILAYLLSNAHRQVTARELMQEVLHTAGDGAAARNQVYELRRKLRQAGVAEVIRTEGRQGYRLRWKTPY